MNFKTTADWHAEGVRRFGSDEMKWKFVCPSCGHIASVEDWKKSGASERQVAFSCVGRHLPNAKSIFCKPGPCDYSGGGLIPLNPVHIEDRGSNVFDFAEVQS